MLVIVFKQGGIGASVQSLDTEEPRCCFFTRDGADDAGDDVAGCGHLCA